MGFVLDVTKKLRRKFHISIEPIRDYLLHENYIQYIVFSLASLSFKFLHGFHRLHFVKAVSIDMWHPNAFLLGVDNQNMGKG